MVVFYLFTPEGRSSLRPFEETAIMAMPETAMNKNDGAKASQHNIRFSWKVADMQPKPESLAMQQTANQYLRLCVSPSNTGHHPASG
jgi:hypothetical protein